MASGLQDRVANRGRRLAAALGFALTALMGSVLVDPVGAVPVPGPDKYGAGASESVAGLFLVAAPQMSDPRFAETVIYMVEHNREGAFGLIVNRLAMAQDFAAFLAEVGVETDKAPEGHALLHYGGPVDPQSGFVLHTADYADSATVPVDGRYAMTPGRAILRAIAEGRGPRRYLIAFGYAGWAPGQLEGEMAAEDWVTSSAEETIMFDRDYASKWRRAFDAHGISL